VGAAPGRDSVTVARRGEVIRDDTNGQRYLELQQGYRFTGTPGELDYQIISFDVFAERLPEERSLRRAQPVDATATRDLLSSSSAEDRAALHWRFSLIVMVPIVALLALSLSKTNHRRGRYIKLAPALLLHLAYLMLLTSGRTRIAEGGAELSLLWGIHAGFLLLALLLLFGGDSLRRLRVRR
jgi:lipopolysaccharide export system permease protein